MVYFISELPTTSLGSTTEPAKPTTDEVSNERKTGWYIDIHEIIRNMFAFKQNSPRTVYSLTYTKIPETTVLKWWWFQAAV